MGIGHPGRGWAPPARTPGRNPEAATMGGWYDQVAQRLGWRLWDWQRHVLHISQEVDDDGWPAHRQVAVVLGRQSGKSALLETLVNGKVLTGHHVIITAQERSIARRMWHVHTQRIIGWFGGRKQFEAAGGYLNQRQGEELLIMPAALGGGSYAPFTPNDQSARSRTADLVVIDEAAKVPQAVLEAAMGTMAARPRWQVWLTSTAGDWQSKMLSGYLDSAEVSAFVWCAEEGDDIQAEETYARALPTYGEVGEPDGTGWGVTRSLLDRERRKDPVYFAREYLSIWSQDPLGSLLTPELWAQLAGDASTVARGPQARIGIDVAPDRAATAIAIAAPDPTGERFVLEMLDARDESSGWLLRRLREVRDRIGADTANRVVVDSRSAAAPHIRHLKRAGFRVTEAGAADYAAHCGALCDLAHLRLLTHRPHPALDAAVASSGRRRLGEAWAWDRHGDDQITALVAASLAVGEVYRRTRPSAAPEPDDARVAAGAQA